MSTGIQCFLVDSEVAYNAFGEVLIGPTISVGWFTTNAGIAYYTLICFLLMIFFLFFAFYREKLKDMGRVARSLLVWRLSILLFAFTAIVGGISRFAIFLGVFHNATEVNLSWAIVLLLRPQITQRKKIVMYTLTSIYLLVELFLSLSLPMQQGYYTLIAMGVWCDLSCLVLVLISMYLQKFAWWTSVAFVAHITYIIFFFINCFISPIGRLVGLGLNVIAIAFSCIPFPKRMELQFKEARSRSNTMSQSSFNSVNSSQTKSSSASSQPHSLKSSTASNV